MRLGGSAGTTLTVGDCAGWIATSAGACRRWDVVHRGAARTSRGRPCAGGTCSRKAARTSWGQPYAGGIWLGGGGKDGGDGGVCQWDLLLRMQPAPR